MDLASDGSFEHSKPKDPSFYRKQAIVESNSTFTSSISRSSEPAHAAGNSSACERKSGKLCKPRRTEARVPVHGRTADPTATPSCLRGVNGFFMEPCSSSILFM